MHTVQRCKLPNIAAQSLRACGERTARLHNCRAVRALLASSLLTIANTVLFRCSCWPRNFFLESSEIFWASVSQTRLLHAVNAKQSKSDCKAPSNSKCNSHVRSMSLYILEACLQHNKTMHISAASHFHKTRVPNPCKVRLLAMAFCQTCSSLPCCRSKACRMRDMAAKRAQDAKTMQSLHDRWPLCVAWCICRKLREIETCLQACKAMNNC
mmetsp:Transcript_140773/g.350941  ORF Transcript_140773/g.350941 Transcript_140773/m.350941 type:complete len:212 (-) Transcript_140773:177-812(-)